MGHMAHFFAQMFAEYSAGLKIEQDRLIALQKLNLDYVRSERIHQIDEQLRTMDECISFIKFQCFKSGGAELRQEFVNILMREAAVCLRDRLAK
jgi:hypothetical protein